MDAITLGLKGLEARGNRMHKYAKLSPSTITMFGNDLDVNKTWLPLMDEFTADYHNAITGRDHRTADGWTFYRITTALREIAQGEATGEVANYTRGYGDACNAYGTNYHPTAYPTPGNAYERGWNQALRDLSRQATHADLDAKDAWENRDGSLNNMKLGR